MKIAVRYIVLGSGLLALGFLVSPVAGRAESVAPPPPQATSANAAPVAAAGAFPASAPGMPAAPGAKAIPAAINTPEIKIPDLSAALPAEKKDIKAVDLSGGKVPDSVKDVIKRLNVKTEDITLDDLNNAREAVAKLDALIDIEKRLVDLDKIRHEREESDKASLMAAIPASALTLPPAFTPPPNLTSQEMRLPPPLPPAAVIDIMRIEGSGNHYTALIKEGDATRLVHAGDHLNDSSVVLSVSTRGVELQRGDKPARLVAVKDVESVFGNNP